MTPKPGVQMIRLYDPTGGTPMDRMPRTVRERYDAWRLGGGAGKIAALTASVLGVPLPSAYLEKLAQQRQGIQGQFSNWYRIWERVTGLTPERIEQIKDMAQYGGLPKALNDVYDTMEAQWLPFAAAKQTRMLALLQTNIKAVPQKGVDDLAAQQIADWVTRNLFEWRKFSDVHSNAWNAIARGASIMEVAWEAVRWNGDVFFRPVDFRPYPNQMTAWVRGGGYENLVMVYYPNTYTPQDIPAENFFPVICQDKPGDPTTWGLYWGCLYNYLNRMLLVRDRMIASQKYVHPPVVVGMEEGNNIQTLDALDTAMAQLQNGSHAYIPMPPGVTSLPIQVLEFGSANISAFYKEQIQMADEEILTYFTGGAALVQEHGTYGASAVQRQVTYDRVAADAMRMQGAAWNVLIERMMSQTIRQNRPDLIPVAEYELKESVDLLQTAQIWQIGIGLGQPTTAGDWAKKFGQPLAPGVDPNKILAPPTPAGFPGGFGGTITADSDPTSPAPLNPPPAPVVTVKASPKPDGGPFIEEPGDFPVDAEEASDGELEEAYPTVMKVNRDRPPLAVRASLVVDKIAADKAKTVGGAMLGRAKTLTTRYVNSPGTKDLTQLRLAVPDMTSYALRELITNEVFEGFKTALAKSGVHTEKLLASYGEKPRKIEARLGAHLHYDMAAGVAAVIPVKAWSYWRILAAVMAKKNEGQFLQQVGTVIESALRDGLSWGQFRDQYKDLIEGGITPGRAYTNFRTSLASCYETGKAQTYRDMADTFPNLQNIAILDGATRAEHAANHGLVLPQKEMYDKLGTPPYDHNCRCQQLLAPASVKPTALPESTREWKPPFQGQPGESLLRWAGDESPEITMLGGAPGDWQTFKTPDGLDVEVKATSATKRNSLAAFVEHPDQIRGFIDAKGTVRLAFIRGDMVAVAVNDRLSSDPFGASGLRGGIETWNKNKGGA